MIKSAVFSWHPERGFKFEKNNVDFQPDVVFFFSEMKLLEEIDVYQEIKEFFPKKTNIIGCSTAKPILMDDVYEGFVTGIALKFEKTPLKIVRSQCKGHKHSYRVGKQIAKKLDNKDLSHVFVISDGSNVNGTALLKGFNDQFGRVIPVTGGMATDGATLTHTFIGLNQAPVEQEVVAVGFYGDNIEIGYAAQGGWEPFGVERIITRSEENILYELDDDNALSLYVEYLGGDKVDLASRALMFPMSIRPERSSNDRIIRTFDRIDETHQSLRFSGDVPQGYIAQFMKGTIEKLSAGAKAAAQEVCKKIEVDENSVVLVVSCLGRQVAMGQYIGDEIDGLVSVLGQDVPLVGFYSHGEFCPLHNNRNVLHNQTMTLTILKEK